jgi:MraZ protein
MITFIGDFECRADAKGRIVLPAAFKKAVGKDELRFVVRKDLFENCLVMYPYSYWEEELERFREKLNPYNRNQKHFMRDFFRGSAELTLDGNGRFLVPKRLMDQAGADREIVMLGVDRYIEIWARDIYEGLVIDPEQLARQAEDFMGDKEK